MKKFIHLFLSILGIVVFVVFGINSITHYKKYKALEFQNKELQREINIADNIDSNKEAVDYYKTLKTPAPEVQLRILERQWLIALETLYQIQLAKYNAILKNDVPGLYNRLRDHIDDMNDRCNFLLTEVEWLGDNITWRIYNMRGSIRLLRSFIVLETEKNWKKVIGTIKGGISDLKLSIDTVDKIPATTFQKNIPRWNLELLHGEQIARKFQFTTVDAERRLELKDNLEAIIPEKGGYAPGEPVERKIKK
ncbi:MAG: hypothetical protein J7M06_06330 [Proteobacteria bacterium]|nr:hypothetical protein [Pseudomonadota bacterium]